MQTLLAQQTLSLSRKDEATFDNFYGDKNIETVAELKKTARGDGERIIYLCGGRGQGCSHLLQASCHYAHQHERSSVYLPLANLIAYSPEMLTGLETLALVCVDDLEVIAGNAQWEEALFHLYNRIYDANGSIILAAHDVPKAIHIHLPDLVSRLSLGVVYQLHPLSDEEKRLVLNQRANQRGIDLPEEVGRYILTHCPRQMDALFAALDALDHASLAAQRRLTIPFVKEVLHMITTNKDSNHDTN